MKIYAKLELKEERNAEDLARAYFKEFNSESSIHIKGMEAQLEIIFDKPPMGIIEEINRCKIIEMKCGDGLKEYKEFFKKKKQEEVEEEASKQTELKEVKEETSEQNTQKEAEEETSKQSKQAKREIPETIPELDEIAKKSTSFENFIEFVAEWIEVDKKLISFKNLVIAATEVEKICWKNLNKVLNDKGMLVKWHMTWIGLKISEKLSITILPFLKVIRNYKNYPFQQFEESNERIILKKRVKMECMPEIEMFEEILARVDKTQTVKKRVRYVLIAMGLDKIALEEQKQLVEIATVAITKKEINLDSIFEEMNIPIENKKMLQMAFSKFINDFVQQYEKNKRVRVLTFLSELQKIIMDESEIS